MSKVNDGSLALPLGRRISLVVGVIAVILAFALQLAGILVSRRHLEVAHRHHTESAAALLAPQVTEALLTDERHRLPVILRTAVHNHFGTVYMAVARPDGTVIAHESRYPLSPGLAALIREWSTPGAPRGYTIQTDQGDALHVVHPLEDGRVGYVHLAFSWSPVSTALRQACLNLVVAMVAGLLVSALLAYVVYRRMMKPIAALVNAVGEIGEGKLAARVQTRPGAQDEVEVLAISFNQMAEKLEQHVAAQLEAERALAHTEKLHVVGQLAAGVAHEINSPLDGAIEASRIIERNSGDPAKVERFARAQRGGLERIATIVRTLLTFSRRPAAREHRAVPVARLLNDAQAIIKHRLAGKHVALVLPEALPPECTVHGDELGLVQVLVNLINNALDVTPEDGTVRVDVREMTESVEIAVTDQGPGIPPDVAPRLFTPFFTTKAVGRGTGLGLATTQSIVTEHRGQVEFANQTGPWGARFTVRLPRRAARRGSGPVQLPETPATRTETPGETAGKPV
jgi:signal transduction histidine kinase